MPKGSEELTKERENEIIDACKKLYRTKSFKEITIKEIGKTTSFTRTSIYNYFQTKEEIFLALLGREHEAWAADLRGILDRYDCLSAAEFAGELAHTLERRGCMLKLMSMNLYDMEGNSRIENLVAFKKIYSNAMQTVICCLEKVFSPRMTAADIQEFLYAFFPFMFGVYPYTTATDKQKKAMQLAHVDYVHYSIYEITESFVTKLLQNFQ